MESNKRGSNMASVSERITKTPGVCGGDACVRGTRITVWGLVQRRRLGLSDAAISDSIQGGLNSADLEAAWAYAAAHADEIEEAIRRNTEA